MCKISIVIPAYNAVNTVERTVRSVMASTLPVEVWAVDDGSTDGTGGVLDRLAGKLRPKNGSCLHVIHQPNSGAYQARLNALKQVDTPYFGFVDADDMVDPKMFEKMLLFAEHERLDVVQCGYEESGRAINSEGDVVVLEGRDEVYKKYIYPKLIDIKESSFIWDKIYRNQYDFASFDKTDNVTNFDDMIFNLYFFLPVSRMGFLREPFYKYATTVGSAVHSFNEKKINDFREAWRIRRVMLPKYGNAAWAVANVKWWWFNWFNYIVAIVRVGDLGVCRRIRLFFDLLNIG